MWLRMYWSLSTDSIGQQQFWVPESESWALGKCSKTPVTENVRDEGEVGGAPLFRDFFPLTFWPVAFRDGGGVPPFPVIKKSVENWPKNSVF